MTLSAIAINCTLKATGESSTDAMIGVLAEAFRGHGVALADTIRIAGHDVKPGTSDDEGEGDAWPDIRRRILAADILIFATPIWLGHMSSIAQRVLERMDAMLGDADPAGRYPPMPRVAVAAVVGNEDGAHHVSSQLFQGLNDIGWTIPAIGACYWVGEAMHKTDFKDLPEVPDKVRQTAALLAANATHLARLLKNAPYPGLPG